jgi:hypothetical protein
MKFGPRIPSLRKRISARTSLKRALRHRLGLKAPRGYGWLTNPKKAAYNRLYRRTSFDLTALPRGKRGAIQAGGWVLLIAVLLLLGFCVAH